MKEAFEIIIDRLEEQKSDWNCDYNVPINDAIRIVNQVAEEYVPDINVGNKWIPCSERLPDKGSVILVSHIERGEIIVDLVRYINGEFEEPNYSEWTLDENCVLAWQPLPDPYQPKGEQ